MPSGLIIPGRDTGAYDRIAGRMAANYGAAAAQGAVAPDEAGDPNLVRDPWQPRWRIDAQWIEFECGCRCERAFPLAVPQAVGDPVIFKDEPEQAVYDSVCARHGAGMNVMVRFGGFADFAQWKRMRKHLLMGRTQGNG